MKHKLLCGILAFGLAFGNVAFADGPSEWARNDIETLEMVGLTTDKMTSGYGEPVTRLAFCELLVKTYKALSSVTAITVSQQPDFLDVDSVYVDEAYEMGFMNGTSDGYFTPDGFLTREQMVASLIRLVDRLETDLNMTLERRQIADEFVDQDQISDWALDQMASALSLGIIGGTGDGQLTPKAYTTVEQALITNYRLALLVEAQIGSEVWRDQLAILNQEVGIVICDVLNLRATPIIQGDNVVTTLSAGDKVVIIDQESDWYYVSTDTYTGYVHSDYIFISRDEGTDTLRMSIREYALNFIGTPYVYGANSLTNGTDCAGFTQSVFAAYGISLSRSSSGQGHDGYGISESELQVGDLVTYGYGGVISHVAMYIGDGQVVHATTSYGVKVTDMYGFLYKPLIGFRRVIP